MAVVCVPLSAIGVAAPQSLAEDATDSSVVLIDVFLQDASGNAFVSDDVSVSVISRAVDDIQTLRPVAEGATNGSAHFVAEVSKADLNLGRTQLELEASSPAESLPVIFDFTIDLRDDATFETTLPQGATVRALSGLVTPTQVGARRREVAESDPLLQDDGISAASPAEAELNQEEYEYVPADDATIGIDARSGQTSCNSDEITSWFATGKFRYPYVPTKYIHTGSRGKFSWDLGQSNQTAMEVSMEIAGKAGKGGLMYSISNSSSTNWQYSAPASSNQVFRIKWKQQKFQKACRDTVPGSSPWHKIDVYRWTPDEPLIGNKATDVEDTFKCAGTGPAYSDWIASKVSVATSSSVNLRGFFSVAGVTLNANQTDASEQVFTIEPRGNRDVRVCGYDDTPKYAKLVKEMTYG